MSTYEYRAIYSSWGIAIDVTATAHRVSVPPSTAERVADDLYLEIAPEVRLDDGERRLLASGLRRVAARVPRDGRALLVCIVAIRFNECDYQAEGLEAAIMAWTAVELGFEPPVVRVAFDRAA
ncbi:MAG TPA: hypothetical protein VFT22_30175, partial [Kofleriaceae bacterium]|nr:hypothetical protein [Kofleriaceae bacterium]